jgi:diguanylate cyclase (GGDEF)-like protein
VIYNIISLYLFATVLLALFFAAFVQARRNTTYSRTIILLVAAVVFYVYGYSMELNSADKEQILFWNGFEYLGIPFVSTLWLTLALMYTGAFYPVKKWLLAYIFIIPSITFITRFTNGFHHLYFADISFVIRGERLRLIKEMGPWMYVQLFHSMSMVIVSLFVLLRPLMTKSIKEAKVGLMLVASFFAVAGLVLNLTDPLGLHIDYMVLMLPLTSICVTIAVVKYDFLEVKTLARDMIFEQGNDAMLLVNMDGSIVDFNQQAKQLFAEQSISLLDSPLNALFRDNPEYNTLIQGDTSGTFLINRADQPFYYKVTTDIISDSRANPVGRVKRIQDITLNYCLNQELKQQATIDALSGVYNRREFLRLAELAFKAHNSGYLCLLMMDLDFFKSINDRYGHMAGDEVIESIGALLKRSFRDTDIAGRLGGEEFALLMHAQHVKQAYEKADAFRQSFEKLEHIFEGNSFRVTISMGLADQEGTSGVDQMINNADKALYRAKSEGRNRVQYYRA